MKIVATFKTPNAVEDSIPDIDYCGDPHTEYDPDCTACIDYRQKVLPWTKRAVRDAKRDVINSLSRFTDGEYVTVEFDTDAGTATVLPRG